MRENSMFKGQSKKKWKRKVVQEKKMIDVSCESNIKNVVEEYLSTENVFRSSGQWSWWSSHISKINKPVSTNQQAI